VSLPQQTIAAGSAVTGAGVLTGFVAKAVPFLQFASLTVGIIVGILTAIYTWRRLRAKKYD
jgi:hypothetical protein